MLVPTLSLCVATEADKSNFNAKELAKKQDQSRLSIQSAAAGPVYTKKKESKGEVRPSISYSDNKDFHKSCSTISNANAKKAHKKRMQNMDERLSQLSMKPSKQNLSKIGSHCNFQRNHQAGRAENNRFSAAFQKEKIIKEVEEQQKNYYQNFCHFSFNHDHPSWLQ